MAQATPPINFRPRGDSATALTSLGHFPCVRSPSRLDRYCLHPGRAAGMQLVVEGPGGPGWFGQLHSRSGPESLDCRSQTIVSVASPPRCSQAGHTAARWGIPADAPSRCRWPAHGRRDLAAALVPSHPVTAGELAWGCDYSKAGSTDARVPPDFESTAMPRLVRRRGAVQPGFRAR